MTPSFGTAHTIASAMRARAGARLFAALPDDSAQAGQAGVEERIADAEEQVMQRLLIREAIEALTPAQRKVIVLTYYEGLTQPEIAYRLAISPSAAGNLLMRGRRALQDALVEQGINA